MCNKADGVCDCIGTSCPALKNLPLTDVQKLDAVSSLGADCSCFCDGLVATGVITESEKTRLIELYRMRTQQKNDVSQAFRATSLVKEALADFFMESGLIEE